MADGPQQTRSTAGVPPASQSQSQSPPDSSHEYKHVRPLSQRPDIDTQHTTSAQQRDKISRLDPTTLIGRPSIVRDRDEQNQEYLIRENAHLKDENAFLRQYVAKCEAQLKQYQLRDPNQQQPQPQQEFDPLQDEFELPPWTLNARYMSPLLAAYEQRITELEAINQQHMADLDTLRREAEQLVQRNRDVETELETNIAKLLQGLEHGGTREGPLSLSAEELADLRESVTLLREQCEIIKTQETEARTQLAQARAQLQERTDEKDMIWARQVKTLKNTIQQQQQEITRLKGIAQTVGSLKTESSQLRTNLTRVTQHEIELVAKLEHAEKTLTEATDKQRTMSSRIETNTRDMENMVRSLEGMEKTLATYKSREVNIIRREQECQERMEQANLVKEQATAKEQIAVKENQRLNERLRTLMDESKRETESTVASIYKKAKETEHKLLDDIKNLELTCADLEHTRDRALRDARSSQLQFDRLVTSTQQEHTRLTEELHKTMATLTIANGEKDQAMDKMQRSRREQQRIQDQWQRENESLTQQMKDARAKLDSQQHVINTQQETISNLQDDMNRTQQTLTSTKLIMEQQIHKLTQNLQQMESEKGQKIADLHHQVEMKKKEAQDASARAASLLQQHDELTSKWKEETQKTIHHFQTLLREQKEREIRLTTQNASLEQRLQSLIQERLSYQSVHEHLQKTNADLQSSLSDAEQRISSYSTQLSTYLAREPELIRENRALQSAIDRYSIETKRLQRQAENYARRQEFVNKANGQVTAGLGTTGRERVPLSTIQNIPAYLSQSTPARPSSAHMYTQLDIPSQPQPQTGTTLNTATNAPMTETTTTSVPVRNVPTITSGSGSATTSSTASATHSRVASTSASNPIVTTTSTAPISSSPVSTSIPSTLPSLSHPKRLGPLPSL